MITLNEELTTNKGPIPFPASTRKQLRRYRKKINKPLLTPEVRDKIAWIVAEVYGVDYDEILETNNRYQPLAEARQAVYWVIRRTTLGFDGAPPGWNPIARIMGKRAHGTISHGYHLIDDLSRIDKNVKARLEKIQTAINY